MEIAHFSSLPLNWNKNLIHGKDRFVFKLKNEEEPSRSRKRTFIASICKLIEEEWSRSRSRKRTFIALICKLIVENSYEVNPLSANPFYPDVKMCTFFELKMRPCTFFELKMRLCTFFELKMRLCTFFELKMRPCTNLRRIDIEGKWGGRPQGWRGWEKRMNGPVRDQQVNTINPLSQ